MRMFFADAGEATGVALLQWLKRKAFRKYSVIGWDGMVQARPC